MRNAVVASGSDAGKSIPSRPSTAEKMPEIATAAAVTGASKRMMPPIPSKEADKMTADQNQLALSSARCLASASATHQPAMTVLAQMNAVCGRILELASRER